MSGLSLRALVCLGLQQHSRPSQNTIRASVADVTLLPLLDADCAFQMLTVQQELRGKAAPQQC